MSPISYGTKLFGEIKLILVLYTLLSVILYYVHFFQQFSGIFAEDMFEVAACYFPIDFTPVST